MQTPFLLVTEANHANRIFGAGETQHSFTVTTSNNSANSSMTTGTSSNATIPTSNIGASESNGASIAMDGSASLSSVFAGWDTAVWEIPSGNLTVGGALPTLKNMTMTIEVETGDKPSDWAVDSVNSAISAGIVPSSLQGAYTNATTRAEFCALAVELYETVMGKEITERAYFEDSSDVNVQKMAALGVVSGVGNNMFSPNASLTREQAATMIARLADAIGKPISEQTPSFSDNTSISSWAYDAVGQMQGSGIMSGVGSNTFSPQGAYTREQSIATMLRLYEIVK